jgi:hypothetical protein
VRRAGVTFIGNDKSAGDWHLPLAQRCDGAGRHGVSPLAGREHPDWWRQVIEGRDRLTSRPPRIGGGNAGTPSSRQEVARFDFSHSRNTSPRREAGATIAFRACRQAEWAAG